LKTKSLEKLKQYIGLEIGDSAYTEFKMKSGEFKPTEDAIFVGYVHAKNKDDAYDLIKNLPENEGKLFDMLVVKEIVDF